jgi:HEAT repeat protein
MHDLLIRLILATGVLLGGLTLLIVVNKAAREAREALDRRRRALLEPAVFEYANGTGHRSIHDYLPKPLSRRDRRLAEAILLDGARVVKGESRDRITAAFEALASVRAAILELRSHRWWKRAEAAERLGLMRSRAAVEPLVTLMNDPMGEVRIRAARALGLIRGTPSIRPLVLALTDPSRWSAIRVAEILIGAGTEAVDELLAAYDSLPHHARISALDILGRVRSLKAAALVRKALADPDADIRARAANALGHLGDTAFADDLVRALLDPQWPVRAMAAKALGRVGARSAIDPLCEALKDRQWWVRANAAGALRALGPAGRDALIRMLDADDAFARHQAVAQLEEGRIIAEYLTDLTSPDAARREVAIAFVEKIIRLERIDHLTQQAIDHAQEGVRLALLKILQRPHRGGAA